MSKEEKKEKEKVKVKEKEIEVITAVYKINLHCPKCAHDIRRPLLRIPGVHSADIKHEKNEVTIKGAIVAKKMHERLQKWSKKKVELISETKVKEAEKGAKETKKETIKTILIKSYMHCAECEREIRKRLLKHKGIHNVKTDIKAQTISIEGVIESEKLLTYMRKKVHKYAEIIPPKAKEKEKEKKDEKKEKEKIEVKIVEFKEVEKVAAKTKEGDTPYFVHYVYAPQLFSDENPNACSIM
ncbi:heavy metal-associated isoprenylated plant protein 4-like [Coffea arabica]|uniref:Heavy metal-associated isoprenylated plant protein 4-like n=1 Tax=Coffea arabica TaxID=13443 RepID=A0A6P6VJI5_COFAR|nr:heavy metal-associated isoprenylated plant protein 4-like [Coffea arabica]